MNSNTWWIGPLVLIALRLLYAEAHFARAQVREQTIVFRPTFGVRLVAGIGIVGLMGAIIISEGKEESWVYGLAVGMVGLICFGLPSTITIGSDGVCQEAWWGRRTTIRWTDVSALERHPGGAFQVFGRDGKTISFSHYHVDSERFTQEILRRASLQGITDAGAPPTLRG